MTLTVSGYSEQVRELSKQYSTHLISQDEYRAKRNQLLDEIDAEYNGAKIPENNERSDQTQPKEQSIFMRTVSFLRNKDFG